MNIAGEILFAVLVLTGVALVVGLGSPWRYGDRGVAGWMSASVWSALLIDGLFLLALLGLASGRWAAWAFLLFVAIRSVVQLWLLRMVLKARQRRS